MAKILVHLRGGVGDIIMATPVIASLARNGHSISLYLECVFSGISELFYDWDCVAKVSADPKDFEQDCFDVYFINWLAWAPLMFKNIRECKIIQCSYSKFIQSLVGIDEMYMFYARWIDPDLKDVGSTYCGKSDRVFPEITKNTVVVAPGCKQAYPAKKWDKFRQLIDQLDDVAVVGTSQDFYVENSYIWPKWILTHLKHLLGYGGKAERILKLFAKRYLNEWTVPAHVKNYIDKLSLRDTAALISQAGVFVGNDSGQSHMAAALGCKTIMIFGPTMDEELVIPKENVVIIKSKLPCQPCSRYGAAVEPNIIPCSNDMKCMRLINVEDVMAAVKKVRDID